MVNALSEELVAHVKRDGARVGAELRARQADQQAEEGRRGARHAARRITFRPDPQIFGKQEFDAETIRERLEAKTYLHGGLKIAFRDEAAEHAARCFEHEGGIADYLAKMVAERGKAPTAPQVVLLRAQRRRAASGSRWRCSGPRRTEETVRSYVNGIPTTQGGTHEQGLRAAVVKAVRDFIDDARAWRPRA